MLSGAPAFIMLVLLAALFPTSYFYNAAFALRPRIAPERLWCDHDYPRWGGHTLRTRQTPRARRIGFYHGVGAF